MSARSTRASQPSTAYELFIVVLTVLSLVILVALVLPFSPITNQLLLVYDNLICVVFLFDFFTNLRRASSKREYLIARRGWLDLLGSIPTFGFFKFSGLLRLARLSRLVRITRLLRTKNRRRELVQDVLSHAVSTPASSPSWPRSSCWSWAACSCCSSRARRPTPTSPAAGARCGGGW